MRVVTVVLSKRTTTSRPTAPLHNLPVSLTSFLGREQELIELERLIANPERRCISLVGPGGIGKTRLALQAARQQRAGFAHGVAYVPLASVGSVLAAIPAMAGAVRLYFHGPSDPKQQLLNSLGEKQMLLILDNVEQLLVEGPLQASFVELMLEILQHAPGVKLLVTSREALDLQGEWVLAVGGLAFPETEETEKPDEYAAVALFMQRARHASPGFAFDEADRAGIAQLCRLVEGMPLAIELAATRLRVLSPAEIAQEIAGSLDFLSASVRDLPERHRSMRVVFDQTWQRLSAREREVLSQLYCCHWASWTWDLGITRPPAHILSMAWRLPERTNTHCSWQTHSPILALFTAFWGTIRTLSPTWKRPYGCIKSIDAVCGRPMCGSPWRKTLSLKASCPRRDPTSRPPPISWRHPRPDGSRGWCVTSGVCWRIMKGMPRQL